VGSADGVISGLHYLVGRITESPHQCFLHHSYRRDSILIGALDAFLRVDLPVNTVKLARYLLGRVIVHDTANGRLSRRIVETEAYPVGDAAGYAFQGMTPRNSSPFLER
jgi:hypothetical protein